MVGLNIDMSYLKHAVFRGHAVGRHFIPHSTSARGPCFLPCITHTCLLIFFYVKTILVSLCVYSYLFLGFCYMMLGKTEGSCSCI